MSITRLAGQVSEWVNSDTCPPSHGTDIAPRPAGHALLAPHATLRSLALRRLHQGVAAAEGDLPAGQKDTAATSVSNAPTAAASLTPVGPEVGPTWAFCSCIPMEMHGPTGIVWAELTPLSLPRSAGSRARPSECSSRTSSSFRCAALALPWLLHPCLCLCLARHMCRGTWARVTMDQFRHFALQTACV
jgi:hypothetical protein